MIILACILCLYVCKIHGNNDTQLNWQIFKKNFNMTFFQCLNSTMYHVALNVRKETNRCLIWTFLLKKNCEQRHLKQLTKKKITKYQRTPLLNPFDKRLIPCIEFPVEIWHVRYIGESYSKTYNPVAYSPTHARRRENKVIDTESLHSTCRDILASCPICQGQFKE